MRAYCSADLLAYDQGSIWVFLWAVSRDVRRVVGLVSLIIELKVNDSAQSSIEKMDFKRVVETVFE